MIDKRNNMDCSVALGCRNLPSCADVVGHSQVQDPELARNIHLTLRQVDLFYTAKHIAYVRSFSQDT
jgi:hypothetical protein